ncbi:MAG: SurA N-terminal domain-containing protein [Candidatus Omnitrophica bacterium]|nr:SurA N-terminal domain-containing protein [Candidatus Omnitrophota bacterium]
MLKLLREKKLAKKIIFWILIVISVGAFVIWGAGASRITSKYTETAGEIFGNKISLQEFLESKTNISNNYKLQLGDNYSKIIPYVNINNQAWQQLILSAQAKKLKISISDQEVIQSIMDNPFFHRDRKFDRGIYERITNYFFGASPRKFEEQIRRSLSIKKLYEQTTKDLKLSDEELLQEYKKENQTLSINYLKISAQDFKEKIKITEAEINNYYRDNPQEFKSLPEVKDNQPPALKEIKEKIKEILLNKKADEEAKKTAENYKIKIDQYLIKKPKARFKNIGKKLKIKIITSEPFKRGSAIPEIAMNKEFSESAFTLKPGEISSPLSTPSGCFLIEQEKFTDIDEKKFNEEKETFRGKLLEAKKQSIFDAYVEKLTTEAKLKEYSQSNLPVNE